MGVKLRGVLRCGACGKPRGLGTHLCSPGRRRRRRTRPQNPVTWECPSCRKPRGLRHACTSHKGEFKRRKRKKATADRKARKQRAAAERRARDKARRQAAGKKPRPSRPRGDSHEPGTCGDHDCPRFGCKAYWAGMADCPGPHGDGG